MDTKRTCALTSLLLLFLACWVVPSSAVAMCGGFVPNATTRGALINEESTVVLMRDGTRTVLSMRNHYKGPAQDFAMIVPVPEVFEPGQVKVITDRVFANLDRQTAPMLVEYWEQGDCRYSGKRRSLDNPSMSGSAHSSRGGATPSALATATGVEVKARFDVNEYNIAILSAKESNGLADWLISNNFYVSRKAKALLGGYIAQGMYFFVARVDAKKVAFDGSGHAILSPLRFHYDSEDFALPIRLGLLNSSGKQDVIVYILSKEGRYEVANYPMATIPTNVTVASWVERRFKEFYEVLFDYTRRQHPGAVITEYVGGARLGIDDVDSLGGETLPDAIIKPTGEVALKEVYSDRSDVRSKIHQAMYHDLSKMRTCLDNVLSRAKVDQFSSGEGVFLVTIDEEGEVVDVVIDAGDMFDDDELAKCSRGVLAGMSISPGRTPRSGKAKLVFDYKIGLSRSKVSLHGWTLTRLHARYTSKEVSEDLIFRKAPPITGGGGHPEGKRGSFHTYHQGARYAGDNAFQARYVILNPWTSKDAPDGFKCKATGRWGTQGRERGGWFGSTSKKKTAASVPKKVTLSKSVQREVRAQKKLGEAMEEPKRPKRGWLRDGGW